MTAKKENDPGRAPPPAAAAAATAMDEIRARMEENQLRLELALDAAQAGTFFTDFNTGANLLNESALRLAGLTAEQYDGTVAGWFRLIHPEDRPIIEQHVRDSLATRTTDVRGVEYRIVKPDGEVRHISVSARIFRDAQGCATQQTGLIQDITDRKRMEEQLRKNESSLRRAQQIAGMGFWQLDLATRHSWWSDEIFRIFGYEPQSFRSSQQRLLEMVHPDDRELVRQQIEAGVTSRGPYHTNYRIVRPDGTIRHVHSESDGVTRDAQGVPVHLFGILQDITDRERAEEDLRHARDTLGLVINTAPVFIFWKDRDLRYLGCNERFARSAGFDRATDLLGKTDFDLAWRDLAERYRSDDAEVIATGQPKLNIVEPLATPQGKTIWVETSKAPLRDAEGRIFGVLGVFQDITARREMEAALVAARSDAEAASRAKSAFLATISHEIRTPLNPILGFANLLIESGLNPEQQSYAEIIKKRGEHLLALIDDILDLTRIEAKKIELEREHLRPRDLVADAIKAVEWQALQKGLRLAAEVDPGVPDMVVGDGLRLLQVLLNLLSNAVKFTARGEVVARISVDAAAAAEVDPDHVRLRFEVRDTGIGIALDQQERIFEPFTQADSTMARKFGGSGLGLTIARHLVDKMGGQIGFESRLDVGSRFWFTARLERAEAPAGSPAAPPPAAAPPPPRRRVLVVEDEETNRLLIATLMRKAGYDVQSVEDGFHAITTCRSVQFDLVLMDIQMPGMDGIQTMQALRELDRPANRYTPVVALTAHTMKGDAERFLAAGMDGYIPKPVTPASLAEGIRAALFKLGRC